MTETVIDRSNYVGKQIVVRKIELLLSAEYFSPHSFPIFIIPSFLMDTVVVDEYC